MSEETEQATNAMPTIKHSQEFAEFTELMKKISPAEYPPRGEVLIGTVENEARVMGLGIIIPGDVVTAFKVLLDGTITFNKIVNESLEEAVAAEISEYHKRAEELLKVMGIELLISSLYSHSESLYKVITECINTARKLQELPPIPAEVEEKADLA